MKTEKCDLMRSWEEEVDEEMKQCSSKDELLALYAKYLKELYEYIYKENHEV